MIPPPEKAPNATPVLRTCTSVTAGRIESSSPTSMPLRTSALVTWSRRTTSARTSPTRAQTAALTPWIRLTMIPPTSHSTIVATIGLRSSGPNGGMKRRKIDRYGSLTSRRKSSTDRDQREYGSRPPTLKYMDEKM